MIILGKQMLGNDIDIYLQPLIKELMELWFEGIDTFNASMNQTFEMHAVLIWTINDLLGLGTLLGRNTHTKLACPTCNFDATPLCLPHS